jgi:myosin heavy subunit
MIYDLVDSEDVSEAAILDELRSRYSKNEIYSAIGPILIALNPYRAIAGLYSAENVQLYKSQQNSFIYSKSTPPHVWTIGQSAFSQLQINGVRQAIVVSGESGGNASIFCR